VQKLLQNFKNNFIQIFTYGLTPFKLVVTLSFGVTLGLFPFIGLTSILCIDYAIIFRLNVIVIQLVNWIVSPLQLIMLVPFYQLGNYFNTNILKTKVIKIEMDYFAQNKFLRKILLLVNSQILSVVG
jgi:uncharacterized protein (DUF2062 family)